MDSHLQSLIDKIKSDGVAEAEKQGRNIIAEAENRASAIIAAAEDKAKKLVEQAKDDAAKTEAAGKKALEQAGRNLILGTEKKVTELFDRLLKGEIANALTPEVLAGLLEKIVAKWEPQKGIAVEISEKDAEILSRGLIAKIQEKAKTGFTVKPVESMDSGFLIGEKDGNVYYDFSDRSIAEILSLYLNPMLAEILKKGIK